MVIMKETQSKTFSSEIRLSNSYFFLNFYLFDFLSY